MADSQTQLKFHIGGILITRMHTYKFIKIVGFEMFDLEFYLQLNAAHFHAQAKFI